ncbi:MAG: UPF0149 family protein [Rubrivivax sp.]|nr:UPF0149 family protein [Rubrivivax sp.]
MQYPDYQPALPSPPLTDAELQALDALLAQAGERAAEPPMNVEMLDGYLTALLVGPTPLAQKPSAQWMPALWGGDRAESAAGGAGQAAFPFGSGKQKKQVIVMVLRHLHAIDVALRQDAEHWEPVFSVAETADREWADAEDWCIGFLQAVADEPEAWGTLFDDPQLGPRLLPIGLLGGDEAQLPEAERQRLADPEHRDALSRQVPEAVLALVARRTAAAGSGTPA